MINEERVKVMTKMALYESKSGVQDLKISSYYKKDYTSLNTLITALWVTIGYGILAGILVMGNYETLMEGLTMQKFVILGFIAVGGYIVVLIAYIIGASIFYKNAHNRAKRNVKNYYRELSRLGKIYKKENR